MLDTVANASTKKQGHHLTRFLDQQISGVQQPWYIRFDFSWPNPSTLEPVNTRAKALSAFDLRKTPGRSSFTKITDFTHDFSFFFWLCSILSATFRSSAK